MGRLGAFRWSPMGGPHRLTYEGSMFWDPKSSYALPRGQRQQSPVVPRSSISGDADPIRRSEKTARHHYRAQAFHIPLNMGMRRAPLSCRRLPCRDLSNWHAPHRGRQACGCRKGRPPIRPSHSVSGYRRQWSSSPGVSLTGSKPPAVPWGPPRSTTAVERPAHTGCGE